MELTPDKVIVDGRVAILLVGRAHPYGWSTDARAEHRPMLVFDKALISARRAGVTNVEDIVERLLGERVHCAGWPYTYIEWVAVGAPFSIRRSPNEYGEILTALRRTDDVYEA